MRLDLVFRTVWGIVGGAQSDAEIIQGCADIFCWLIEANAPGTFEMVVGYQIFTLVAAMISSEITQLQLAGLRICEVAHTVGEQYTVHFAQTDAPIDAIVYQACSGEVDLQVGAVNCFAAMLGASPDYFPELPNGLLQRGIERCQDGTFRQLQAHLRLLAAAVPLCRGEYEFDVAELVRLALDTLTAEDAELSYLCLGLLQVMHAHLAETGRSVEVFLTEFAAAHGPDVIGQHCGGPLAGIAQQFLDRL
jgi:hypothetical protein